MVIESVASACIGFAFGWLLQKAGLTRYDRIVGVYRLTDLAVMKFLLSALVAGAICLRLFVSLGVADALPVPATYWAGNLAGGVLFGIGMAASGFCPGTVAAGAGEGRLDYLIAGIPGLFAGALAFGLVYPAVFRFFGRHVMPGATLSSVLGVNPWTSIVLLAEVTGLLFYALERGRKHQ
jgi:uncharacterized membrane protein YedE/YeeE